ncbi:hypothetical protein CLOP_g14736, partial [Closterium sp. NIES-67]
RTSSSVSSCSKGTSSSSKGTSSSSSSSSKGTSSSSSSKGTSSSSSSSSKGTSSSSSSKGTSSSSSSSSSKGTSSSSSSKGTSSSSSSSSSKGSSSAAAREQQQQQGYEQQGPSEPYQQQQVYRQQQAQQPQEQFQIEQQQQQQQQQQVDHPYFLDFMHQQQQPHDQQQLQPPEELQQVGQHAEENDFQTQLHPFYTQQQQQQHEEAAEEEDHELQGGLSLVGSAVAGLELVGSAVADLATDGAVPFVLEEVEVARLEGEAEEGEEEGEGEGEGRGRGRGGRGERERIEIEGAIEEPGEHGAETGVKGSRKRRSVLTPNYPPESFQKAFRMSRETFMELCDMLAPLIVKTAIQFKAATISGDVRLGATLWRLATAEPMYMISKRQLSAAEISAHFLELCGVDHASWAAQQLGNGQLIGTLYTTHLPIKTPPSNLGKFLNKQHTERFVQPSYSIAMQAAIDANGQFINLCIGLPGALSDEEVLQQSSLFQKGQAGELKGAKLIGSRSYPLQDWLLVPYDESDSATWHQTSFNECLEKGIAVGKDAIGRLKGRWRILLRRAEGKLHELPRLVGACCALHNFLEQKGEALTLTGRTKPLMTSSLRRGRMKSRRLLWRRGMRWPRGCVRQCTGDISGCAWKAGGSFLPRYISGWLHAVCASPRCIWAALCIVISVWLRWIPAIDAVISDQVSAVHPILSDTLKAQLLSHCTAVVCTTRLWWTFPRDIFRGTTGHFSWD